MTKTNNDSLLESVAMVSPIGIANYPYIDKPNNYKGEGKYQMGLLLDPSDEKVKEFCLQVEDFLKRAFEARKETVRKSVAKDMTMRSPFNDYIELVRDEDGNVIDEKETGLIEFKFSCKSKPVKKNKKNVEDENLKIFPGDKVRALFYLNDHYMPTTNQVLVSKRFFSVQLVDKSESYKKWLEENKGSSDGPKIDFPDDLDE